MDDRQIRVHRSHVMNEADAHRTTTSTQCTSRYITLIMFTELRTTLQTFSGPLSGTTRVSRYQKGKTNLDFTEARDSEWQWHPLDHMQVCMHLAPDRLPSQHPNTELFTGQMPFLMPNQLHQSTEGIRQSTELRTLLLF